LEYKYSKLLKIIPKRDAEAEQVLKRSEERWQQDICMHNTIEDVSMQGIVDLQTERLYYLS